MSIKDEIISKFIYELKVKLNPYLIYQFGSSLTENFHPESDIDLAYLSHVDISQYDNYIVAQELAEIAGRSADLINLKTASTVLRVQILSKGKVIYCSDDNKRVNFIINSLKEYALLNEERYQILEQIKARGEIYA